MAKLNADLIAIYKKIAKGDLVFREAVKKEEINILKLTSKELLDLNNWVQAGLKSTQYQTSNAARDINKLIQGGTSLEDGGFELKAAKFSVILTNSVAIMLFI